MRDLVLVDAATRLELVKQIPSHVKGYETCMGCGLEMAVQVSNPRPYLSCPLALFGMFFIYGIATGAQQGRQRGACCSHYARKKHRRFSEYSGRLTDYPQGGNKSHYHRTRVSFTFHSNFSFQISNFQKCYYVTG